MGGLLSSSSSPPTSVTINFADPPVPDQGELAKLHGDVAQVLARANEAMPELEGYQGCEDMIRLAMSNPKDEAKQVAAFEGMFPNVRKIRNFYQLGKDVDQRAGSLVREFVANDDMFEQPGLTKQFAELLVFALRFDRCKMMHPAVQNDFSFYRRALNQKANSKNPSVPVNDIEANNISMFIAQATPVISTLVITLDNLQREIQVADFIADFAHVCCSNVMRDKARTPEATAFGLTAMVVAIVIYDQISPAGAFGGQSQI